MSVCDPKQLQVKTRAIDFLSPCVVLDFPGGGGNMKVVICKFK